MVAPEFGGCTTFHFQECSMSFAELKKRRTCQRFAGIENQSPGLALREWISSPVAGRESFGVGL